MTIKIYIAFILYALLSTLAFGQRTETALNFNQKTNRLVFETENDVLFKSDHYYTAGLAFSYTNKNLKKTPAQLILKPKSPKSFSFNGFGIEQRMYTPYSITKPDSILNDRPYAAYILVTNYSVLINPDKNLKIVNEIGLGIMGPAAGGREVQSFIHEIIDSAIPIGWEFQLRNAFLVDYQFRIEKGFFSDWIARHFIPFAKIRLGTLTDRIGFGLMTRVGNANKLLGEVSNTKNLTNHFIWEWVFEANLYGVFYDATLQGGLFNGEEVIRLNKQNTISRQYQLRMGVNLYYRSFYLRYMVKFNSKDFTSGVIHRYGGVNIGVSF